MTDGRSGLESVSLVTMLALFVLLFVWPGVFRYEMHVQPSGYVRVDRLTHRMEQIKLGTGTKLPAKWETVVQNK